MNRRYLSIWFPQLPSDLHKLCLSAKRFTPITAIDEPDGLLLDTTGCDHLFGGEQNLAVQVAAHFRELGLEARVGFGSTILMAHAQSRFGPRPTNQLPIQSLRLPDKTQETILLLGICSMHELLRLPRPMLMKRFGKIIIDRIDELLGDRNSTLKNEPEPEIWSEELLLTDSIRDAGYLIELAQQLVKKICVRLEGENKGLMQMDMIFSRGNKQVDTMQVATARPTADAQKLIKLLTLKIERHDLGESVDAMVLQAKEIRPLQIEQICSSPSPSRGEGGVRVGDTLDVLINRLGSENVFQLLPVESHIPENTVAKCHPHPGPLPSRERGKDRPLRLFEPAKAISVIAMLPDSPPARLIYKNHVFDVVHASGPERIEGEWWHADQPTRDYYCVENATGLRLWIYRAEAEWFLHGVFA